MSISKAYPAYGGAGPWMLGLTWSQAIIALVLVTLRAIFARVHSGKTRVDLIFVVLGALFGLVGQVGITIDCLHGAGNHLIQISPHNLWIVLHYSWIGLMVGAVGITFAKISVVSLLLQITPIIQPRRRAYLWTLGALVVVVNAVLIPISLLQCTPAAYLWDRSLPGGSCPGAEAANDYGYFQGAVAILVDLLLAFYPITVIWSLKMSLRSKIAFCFLMAGGLFPASAGILRTYYTKRVISTTDLTYELYPFLTWAMTEGWFVIILGSIPPLRPLFERIFRHKTHHDLERGSSAPQTVGSWRVNAIVRKETDDSQLESLEDAHETE